MRNCISVWMMTIALAAPAAAQDRGAALAAADAARFDAGTWRDVVNAAQDAAREARSAVERDSERQSRNRDQRAYDQAQRQLDQGHWEAAAKAFAEVAATRSARADGALYWQAYAQDRAGQRSEALATIAELSKTYPDSRYRRQAQALEVEVRSRLGQPVRPEAQADEELKLIAVNALLAQNPDRALPLLEKVLQNPSSPRLQERALFVLAQTEHPRARQIILGLAKGGSTPEMQQKAIQYLGVQGAPESRAALADLYGSIQEVDVRRQILRAFMVAGDKDRLLTAARSETNPELRVEAVRQLGVMGAHDELWQLYQKEASIEVKKPILQAMFVGGDATRLIELARSETNPELRRTAVRNLGMMEPARTNEALVSIYNAEKDPDIRRAVIDGLGMQNNAAALVALARKETDPAMKKRLVERLSIMPDKVAIDYMLELLNK